MSDTVEQEYQTDITKFYEGKTIFVTGATGFLGKLLLEKLLRCTNPKMIYVLLREKKGKQPEERFKELFAIPAFDHLRELKPNYQEKMTIIEGDLIRPELGIKEDERNTLINEVNCIFHSGATVRFDEELQKAAFINVRSTRDLLTMALEMKDLQSFVHISTAYSNCLHKTIEEIFYDPLLTGKNLLKLVECLDVDVLRQITPTLINGNPNTYVFTKAIAEDVIKQYMTELPLAMVRPSVVISSYKEPLPGWLDNFYGPTSILFGACFGLLRALHCDKNLYADLVPVDYVINSVIAAGWDVAKARNTSEKKGEHIPDKVYNYVSSTENPLTWASYEELAKKHALKIPSPMIIWNPTFFYIKNRILCLIYLFFCQTIPAYIVDLIIRLIGKKPMMVNAYKKIARFCGAISFFTTNCWKFKNDNTVALWSKLSDKDKELYPFDISSLEWDDYFKDYIIGARVYLLKDPLDTVPQGRRKLTILKYAHYTLMSVLSFLLFKFLLFIFKLF